MAKRSVEFELDELKTLEHAPEDAELDAKLIAALKHRTGLIVSRAASMALKLKRAKLARAMIDAFERFLAHPRNDSGCLAKTAIAKALYEFGESSAEGVFLAGVKHVQVEASFGRPADTAGELRGICGLGLVRIGHRQAMTHLVDLLADPVPQTRCFAARALAYSERDEAALLLRLKLHHGDHELEVMTECMNALVRLEPRQSLKFLEPFLNEEDSEIRTSAALALGESRQVEAFDILQARSKLESDREVRRSVLLAVAMLRMPQAIEWLVELLSDSSPEIAMDAIEALAMYRRDEAVRRQIATAVKGRNDKRIQEAHRKFVQS